MKPILACLALLAVTACAVPLTGDQAQDCLNARNGVIRAQNLLTGANGALTTAIALDKPDNIIAALSAGVTAAQTAVDTATAQAIDLCRPPVTVAVL
jgi:hypothetical protein